MHNWRFPSLSLHGTFFIFIIFIIILGIEGAFYNCGEKTVIPRKVI